MKIGITGHTKGLGNSLVSTFKNNGHVVLGYSRSNGYDISIPANRNSILDNIDNFDVFVNNAYHPTGQLELLTDVVNRWEGRSDKYIINISSKIIHIESNFFPDDVLEYKTSKIKLKNFTDDYSGNIKIYNVVFDLLKTDFVLSNLYFNPQKDGIDTTLAASLIYDIFKYKDSVYMPTININRA